MTNAAQNVFPNPNNYTSYNCNTVNLPRSFRFVSKYTMAEVELLKKLKLLKIVKCDAPRVPFVARAETRQLFEIFQKYATHSLNDERYMTLHDFVVSYLGLLRPENYNEETMKVLAGIADTTKDGLVSFQEFQTFEALLCAPDAMYATAFQMFDTNGNGYVTFDEFSDVLKRSTIYEHVPFDFDSEFIDLRFGKDRKRLLTYGEFTKVLHDFNEEHALQAFRLADRDRDGYISAAEFNQIMVLLKNHLMTRYVKENLVAALVEREKMRRVSFPYFTAFISLLNNMELVKRIYLSLNRQYRRADITREEFLNESQHYTQVTPMEIDILFSLAGGLRVDGKISNKELDKIAPIQEERMAYTMQAKTVQEALEKQAAGKGRTGRIEVLESAYRFLLGSIAGAVGATAVYPIDLVKTRMQNQRITLNIGEPAYRNSWDCFKKVLRFEGFFGLYRGLLPQLVGVAPEKAIKLTVNDLVRDKMTNKDGSITLQAEILAGCCAGASQVVFTNPLEIVKIRLQTAGEIAGAARPSALKVVRELGIFGLYKGSRACFLRDIPFSGIYFPVYTYNKRMFADENGYNSPLSLLMAATLAGMPAAALPTPADVIKTRLQVQARKGQTTYAGVVDAFRKILREEGGSALWKGTPARVFRSSPQFGVTLLTYEMLQRAFYVDFGGRKPTGMRTSHKPEEQFLSNPDHIGGYKLALATFEGIESKFGICFPKFASSPATAK